jgi:hypothetical protein
VEDGVSPWGDRDTTCAIVGGIVAPRLGEGGIPDEWIARREPLPSWVDSFSTDIGAQLIAILESQPSSPRTPPMLTMAPAASPSLEDCPRARECCGTAVVTPESKEGATVG